MDEVWLRAIAIMIGAALGSGGFWTYLRSRDTRRSARERLTMGLAYGQIVSLGQEYIRRGSVTHVEYNDYQKYLYQPYVELGGNGGAMRMMARIEKLPFGPHDRYPDIFPTNEERVITNVRVSAAPRQDTSVE
jgi:hypothetical protein